MTDRAAAYSFSLLLVCFTVWLCFRGIAWVIQNGWRSMLGLVAVRGEAVIEWQDCDVKPGTDDGMLAVAEAAKADDFTVWEAELAGEKGIVKNLRRMDRWSS